MVSNQSEFCLLTYFLISPELGFCLESVRIFQIFTIRGSINILQYGIYEKGSVGGLYDQLDVKTMSQVSRGE